MTGGYQSTLARPAKLEGVGFWEGTRVEVTLLPADADTGIRFCRTDLAGSPMIPALVEQVQSVPFRTRISAAGAAVDMTEHLLATLYSCGIDNCIVHVNAQELPAFDGSSQPYLAAIEAAGTVQQDRKRELFVVRRALRVGDPQHWIMAVPLNSCGWNATSSSDAPLSLEYRLDYGPQSVISPCSFQAVLDRQVFAEQIASARTFVTASEAAHIQSLGLAKHVTHNDLLVFDVGGPIANRLRSVNECARHKLLDLVGDLALAGVRVSGRIIAYRSGHALNAKMASFLRMEHRNNRHRNELAVA